MNESVNCAFCVLESDGDNGQLSQCESDTTEAYSMDELDPHQTRTSDESLLASELHFWYIAPEGGMVNGKDQAAVTFNG